MKIEEMIAANRADCSGCEACANICPKNAITMTRDAEGFAYPKINPDLCIKCGRCDATCPSLNYLAKKNIKAFPKTFVATYDNDKVLRHSSSGGAFSALSEIILRGGGVVFGAGFDKNFHVVHTSAKNLDELENLRGSKYVQSQIGDVYRQVRDALKSSSVLFCGTACQCAGLKHFLGKDHDNLLTVDVLCHGTPSPALWENYVAEIGYAHEVTQIHFRSKRDGWGQNMDIIFADREYRLSATSNNLYGRIFLRNLSLRPSCHICKFRFPNGKSDLSLGDAWGIKDFAPSMFDNRGVSVVFIHTAKGKQFFEQANFKKQQVKFPDAVKRNRNMIIPAVADSRREQFFSDLAQSDDWFAVMQKYFYQDDEAFRKETGRKKAIAFQKRIRALAAQIRKRFAKNILIAASPRDKDEQKTLENFLEKKFKGCGVYILQPKDDEQFACKETFSSLTVVSSPDAAALYDFVKKYSITEIHIEEPLKFGEASSQIIERLKACCLPVKVFQPNENK